MDPEDHSRPGDLPEFPLTEVLSVPSVKLVVRDPAVAPEELLATALELDLPGVAPSTSGAPFLEVASAGVDKGTGLVRIAGALGVRADEVIAFGDNLNDLEMLAWAGHGVAMGNALPEVIAVTVPDHRALLLGEGLADAALALYLLRQLARPSAPRP